MPFLKAILLLFYVAAPWHASYAAEKTQDLGESESGLEKETWDKAEKNLASSSGPDEIGKYLKLFPHGAHAGRAYLIRGRLQENLLQARQDFQEAAGAPGPWAAEGALELGKLEYSLGRYTQAEEALDACLATSKPGLIEALYWRGQSRLMKAKFQAAQQDFWACLKSQPDFRYQPLASLGSADCAAALGNTTAALEGYAALYGGEGPVAAQALWQAASLQERLGRREAAHASLETLARRYPASFEGGNALRRLKAGPTPVPVKETPRATPATDVEEAGRGFWVQVGSYSSGAWADKLVKSLKKKKYPVSKRVVRVKGHAFHEIRIGSYPTRAAALAAGKKIAAKEGLPFLVKPLE